MCTVTYCILWICNMILCTYNGDSRLSINQTALEGRVLPKCSHMHSRQLSALIMLLKYRAQTAPKQLSCKQQPFTLESYHNSYVFVKTYIARFIHHIPNHSHHTPLSLSLSLSLDSCSIQHQLVLQIQCLCQEHDPKL